MSTWIIFRKGESSGINKFKLYLSFMNTQQKTAIILGATGLTGNLLLQLLSKDNRYGKIKLFSRSSSGIVNPKIEEHIGDVVRLDAFKNDVTFVTPFQPLLSTNGAIDVVSREIDCYSIMTEIDALSRAFLLIVKIFGAHGVYFSML